MNKKITVVAVLMIIVGIIGTIYSSVSSIPYFINVTSQIEKELNKESVIYNKDIKIDKLNVNTEGSNVIIKKHNENDIKITQKGSESIFSYKIEDLTNQLLITENKYKKNHNKISDINSFIDYAVKDVFSYDYHSIIIYIPNDVDINVSTKNGDLDIQDDVFLNNVKFTTLSGNISMPNKVKTLDKLDIKSENYIQMSMSELLGIKNIYLNSHDINIYSSQDDIFIDNIEQYIPNNMNLENNKDTGYLRIDTDIPVANNLNINAYKSTVEIKLPIEKYKMNFDVKTLQEMDLYSLVEKNIITENEYSKYSGIRALTGNLNKNLDNLEKEYKVNIKSEFMNID